MNAQQSTIASQQAACIAVEKRTRKHGRYVPKASEPKGAHR